MGQVKLINFQNLILQRDFNTYHGRAVFDIPEQLVGTNILMFLEY